MFGGLEGPSSWCLRVAKCTFGRISELTRTVRRTYRQTARDARWPPKERYHHRYRCSVAARGVVTLDQRPSSQPLLPTVLTSFRFFRVQTTTLLDGSQSGAYKRAVAPTRKSLHIIRRRLWVVSPNCSHKRWFIASFLHSSPTLCRLDHHQNSIVGTIPLPPVFSRYHSGVFTGRRRRLSSFEARRVRPNTTACAYGHKDVCKTRFRPHFFFIVIIASTITNHFETVAVGVVVVLSTTLLSLLTRAPRGKRRVVRGVASKSAFAQSA